MALILCVETSSKNCSVSIFNHQSLVGCKEELDDNNKLNNLLKKDSVKSYFSYLDLKKNYINQDLDYLKFLIETQKSEAFFSEPKEFSRLVQYLKILTKEKDEDLSSISQKLLKSLLFDSYKKSK